MEIIVEPKAGYCLWQVLDTNEVGRKPVDLNVKAGCELLCFSSSENQFGTINSVLRSGQHELNGKKQKLTSLKLIACNVGQTIKVFRGVFGLPYKDFTDPTERETGVGVSASCEVKINDVQKFYEAFSSRDTVTVDEVNEKFCNKFAEILRSRVSAVLAKGTPYQSLTEKQSKLSTELEETLDDFVKGYGCRVILNSFALGDFAFSEEYLEARRGYGDEQNELRKEKERNRLEDEKRRSEIDALKTVLEAKNQNGNPSVCPKCKNKIKNDARFCPICGAKI